MTKAKNKEPEKRTRNPIEYIKKYRQDYILYRASQLFVDINNDPMRRSEAVSEITQLISYKSDKTTRSMFIDSISDTYKVGKKMFNDELKQAEVAVMDKPDDDPLPKGIDRSDWDKYGFYEDRNAYYFRERDGKKKFSNFVMQPIFHIDSNNVNESLRIYELTNEFGLKIVLDFDMNEMTSVTGFKRKMESRGNFLFWGQESHINQLKQKLYKETTTCTEIRNLGWQKEGFWAWSNGISTDKGFSNVDDYGRIAFENQNYYIPAFSKIYIKDKSVFMDERKFRFMDTDISLTDWAKRLVDVFGDNAKIGIAFYTATLFRDYLLHIFKNFALLNLFGPKGTGKSQLAVSLSCMFGIQQTPFNIHNGTKAGLAEHIQQFCNAFAWIDEYKNNIDYEKIETLKSIYDAIGRNRLNFENRKKKETTQVNSAVILSGQEMPTADVALFSRMVFCQFHQDKYSTQEKQNYDDLKTIEGKGLSHITAEIIQYRKTFEREYFGFYEKTLKEFSESCEKENIEDRIIRSMVMITAAFRTLTEGTVKLDFGFDYAEMKRIGLKSIIAQQAQMKSSNEVSVFWHTVEALASENELEEGWEYRVQSETGLNLRTGKIQWEGSKIILQIRFNEVCTKYRRSAKSSGVGVLPPTTLQYYLQNSPYFLGDSKGTKFKTTIHKPGDGPQTKKKTTTAMCFDYTKLREILNIDLISETENYIVEAQPTPKQEETPVQRPEDDFPF